MTTTAVAALLLAAHSTAAAQDDRYRLRLSDRVGDVNRYRLSFDMRMQADLSGGGPVDERARRLLSVLAPGMGLHTTIVYEQELAAVAPDGTRTFEVRWHDFELAGDVGGRPVPRPSEHVASTREILSHPARFRATPRGRTVDVSYGNPVLARYGRRFQLLNGMPTYLPAEPVAVGDRWSSVARFPVGLPGRDGAGVLELELEHVLRSVRDGRNGPIAVIDLAGSYSQMQGIEQAATTGPFHLQATLSGTTEFDVALGRFVEGHYQIDMIVVHAARGVEVELTGRADGNLELVHTP